MFLRLHTSPVIQIGNGTDHGLPIYACAIDVQPIQDSDREVSNTTITVRSPGAELRSILAQGPIAVSAELCDDAGAVLFAGEVEAVSYAGADWTIVLEV